MTMPNNTKGFACQIMLERAINYCFALHRFINANVEKHNSEIGQKLIKHIDTAWEALSSANDTVWETTIDGQTIEGLEWLWEENDNELAKRIVLDHLNNI